MVDMPPDPAIVGVDGCPGGWIAVSSSAGKPPSASVFPAFRDLLAAFPPDAVIAVDMPIGLPEATSHGGRGPESLVRPLLRPRQSSVFSIPSRPAVYADVAEFSTVEAWYAAHHKASAVARATSSPPRGVLIQAFALFSKIREIDALLIERPDLRLRVFESHPEVAFRALDGARAMRLPKKVKGALHPAGMEERRELLSRRGFDRPFLDRLPPQGARHDDFLDACAMMLVARRIASGAAVSYPDPPARDRFGIPIAIWA